MQQHSPFSVQFLSVAYALTHTLNYFRIQIFTESTKKKTHKPLKKKLSVDSQNEARATGSSVMNSRRAIEPLARFTLRTQRVYSVTNKLRSSSYVYTKQHLQLLCELYLSNAATVLMASSM